MAAANTQRYCKGVPEMKKRKSGVKPQEGVIRSDENRMADCEKNAP
jgi:hypothetical protein